MPSLFLSSPNPYFYLTLDIKWPYPTLLWQEIDSKSPVVKKICGDNHSRIRKTCFSISCASYEPRKNSLRSKSTNDAIKIYLHEEKVLDNFLKKQNIVIVVIDHGQTQC